jgi:hypothetical protein
MERSNLIPNGTGQQQIPNKCRQLILHQSLEIKRHCVATTIERCRNPERNELE